MEKSSTTSILDNVRYLIIIAGTISAIFVLRASTHWSLAVISVIPMFFVMFCLADLITLPLYFMTPEQRVTSVVLEAIEKDDFDTALRTLGTYENSMAEKSQSGATKSDCKENELVNVHDEDLLEDDICDLVVRCEELIDSINEMIHDDSLDPEEIERLLQKSKAELQTYELLLSNKNM